MSRFVEPVARPTSNSSLIPTRIELFRPFEQVFDKFFDDMFANRNLPDLFKGRGQYPKIDVYSDSNQWILEAHCPGVSQEALTVEIGRESSSSQDLRGHTEDVNVLTISGKMQDAREASDTTFHVKELSRAAFVRKVVLPPFLNDQPVATMKNGVLKLTWEVASKKANSSKVIPINGKE
jgi:HSP20 family molecular chaperone IbpA